MAFGKEINITKDAQTNSATTITTNSCSVEFELSGDDTTWLSNVGITSSNRLSFTAAKNGGSTAPTYNANADDYRIYAKGTLTISSSAVIKKAVFNSAYAW